MPSNHETMERAEGTTEEAEHVASLQKEEKKWELLQSKTRLIRMFWIFGLFHFLVHFWERTPAFFYAFLVWKPTWFLCEADHTSLTQSVGFLQRSQLCNEFGNEGLRYCQNQACFFSLLDLFMPSFTTLYVNLNNKKNETAQVILAGSQVSGGHHF